MYTHTYIFIYMYVCIYLYMYVYIYQGQIQRGGVWFSTFAINSSPPPPLQKF